MKDEIKSLEHIISFFFIIFTIILTLYISFTSKALQLIVLMLINTFSMTSYYQVLAMFVLGVIWPFVCMLLSYDAIYRDLEDER